MCIRDSRTYADGSTAIFRWHYRKEFVNPALRRMLPSFEFLWWATLGAACVLCLVFNTLWLRRRLAAKLKLFSDISKKIGAQELDFTIPHAGIREYDQALDAMEQMRKAVSYTLLDVYKRQGGRGDLSFAYHDPVRA